ncbi:hypothetical protein KY290_011390 [Solanum tuberosum]|uniref:PB1-like domain-containing protein n=1 Tax=Solanum tuberosum TaxID=4113 RepID=A0ABQ7W2I0_SOLTU|nr:hypothetical protein KY285_012394 [Solanum tuberosum]KAH0774253.1 hypothetical protein KY290_011390 [Solanum tuberosum]
MDSYILTCFHHGGCVVGNPNPTYQREVDVFGVGIDKDHFSLVEFLSYTKDLGYTNVKGFYCEDNNELVQVTSDTQLLEFVKDLVDGDEFHVYVVHEVDELEELPAPTGLLPWSDTVDESVGINTEGTVENDSDLNGVDTELPRGDTNQNEAESDLPSSDTDVDVIPDEDDSDVDEELRSLRAERRNKRNPNLRKKRDREKKTITKEVPIGEAGVDRGFEDIGINKKDKYVGRLGGDEKYIDSSECDSDDSTDILDAEAVGGVDLPGRRKTKKVRPPRNRRKSKDESRKKYGKMSKQGLKITCSKCKQQGHNKKYCKVGVHTSQPASHSSQFTAGQSSQGSCHPEPTSSFQPGPTRFNQPASTTSNSHASSTTVCGHTSRVKRARETAKTSQPPPFVDTSIPVTRGITSQLPTKTRQTAGQKRGRVATGEDSARGGPKMPTNGGSSNVGFGIYTSASGTQILNPGTSSQRILPTGLSYKDASLTGIDLGFKPRGLRWKNKDAVTTSQLQQMANKKKK